MSGCCLPQDACEFIIIQGIGFLGLLAGIIAVQFNKHKTIVLWKTVMEILFIVLL